MNHLHSKKIFLALLLLILTIPTLTMAQANQFLVPCIDAGAPCITSFNVMLAFVLQITWVVFTLIAVICFVIAGVLFLTAQGDPAKLKIARSAVIWGVVGIVVAILAFSIITIVGSVLT